MMFMNEWEVQCAAEDYADHPTLGPAAQTLQNLMEWTNRNSDGWAYWPKPCRAAAKLQGILEGARMRRFDYGWQGPTAAQIRAAYSPIKAFRTRQGAEFTIVDPS